MLYSEYPEVAPLKMPKNSRGHYMLNIIDVVCGQNTKPSFAPSAPDAKQTTWALGSGLWALGSGLWALGFGLRALGSEVWALGYKL